MEKVKEKLKWLTIKKAHIFIIILGIIYVALGVFHSNVWFDEAYSVGMANHSFSEIWNIGGHDVHPVLYYWMLRVICLITGGSVMAYRIFSCVPIAILGILGYTHIRKDYGEKTGIIFSFLSYFLPQMTIYAAEVRMYSWAILFVTILAIYAMRLSKKQSIKNWIIFFVASLCSIYIHYYGLMSAGLINVCLLVYLIAKKSKKGIATIVVLGIVQAVAYIPWLIYFALQLGQVSHGFWIGFTFPTSLYEIIGMQFSGNLDLTITFVLALVLYGYLLVCYIKLKKEGKEDLTPVKLAIGLYLAVIIAALVVTLVLGTMILYYRYLFVITGLLIFGISYILARSDNKAMLIAIWCVIVGLSCINEVNLLNANYGENNKDIYAYIEENVKPEEDMVYTDIGNGSVIAVTCTENTQYFYNPDNWGVEEAYKAFGPQMSTYIDDSFIEKLSDRFWIVDAPDEKVYSWLFDNDDYTVIKKEEIHSSYHDYGYTMILVEKKAK